MSHNKIMKKAIVKSPKGLHILGEVYTDHESLLKDSEKVKTYVSGVIKKFGLTELGSFYYQFPKSGFTGIISLVESHIAIHTWPEFRYLTLDVFLCNYSRDNSETCKKVFSAISNFFKPKRIIERLIGR